MTFTWKWGLPACYKRKQGEKQSIFNAFPFWCSSKCCFIGGLLKSLSSCTVLYLPQIQLNLFLKMVVLLFHVILMEKESSFWIPDQVLGMAPFPRARRQEDDHRRQQVFYHAFCKSLMHFCTRTKDRWMKYKCKQWPASTESHYPCPFLHCILELAHVDNISFTQKAGSVQNLSCCIYDSQADIFTYCSGRTAMPT